MLLFNWEQVADRLNIKVISKHLMLLFNNEEELPRAAMQ